MKALKLNPHNVDRSGFHRGEHVAYGTNREGNHDVWRVRKMGNRYEATARATGERLSGRTLKEVGAAIEAQSPRFDEGKAPQRNPIVKGSELYPAEQEKAKRMYVHRFTQSHIPEWARRPRPDGGEYEPQFADDQDWLEHSEFAVTKSGVLDKRHRSITSHPTWPTRKAAQRNPPKPGTYAGGVGFWRKSIGLAEGKPKHLGSRPQHTTDVDYVEYVRPLAGEPVFELGGNRYQYVVGRYPSGREDIAVYSFAGDVTHGYAFFRRMLNLT